MQLKELAWVDFLKKKVKKCRGVIVGIGDDCAYVRVGKEKLLFKGDCSLEGVHFKRDTTNLKTIGMRAIARVLSDFAACAAKPLFIGVTLGKSRSISKKGLSQILDGILYYSKKYKFSLVGGDTLRSRKLFLDIWGIGQAKKFILRSTARVGDYIFVTAQLGQRSFTKSFEPRLKEALYLARYFKINAMIDISDGFVLDLFRILKASNKGALLYKSNIPVTHSAHDCYRGEDYELIFTVDARERNIELLKKKFYFVGRIMPQKFGYMLQDARCIHPITPKGYTHF